jgi:hypothetical protein
MISVSDELVLRTMLRHQKRKALQQQRKQRQAEEEEAIRLAKLARDEAIVKARECEERGREREQRPSLHVIISYSTPEERKAAEVAKRKEQEAEELRQRKADDAREEQRQIDASFRAVDEKVKAKEQRKKKEADKAEAERVSRLHPTMQLGNSRMGFVDPRHRHSRFDTPSVEVQPSADQLKAVRDFELYLAHGRMESNLAHAFTNATNELRLKKGKRQGWKWVDGTQPTVKHTMQHDRMEWLVKGLPAKRPVSAVPAMITDRR